MADLMKMVKRVLGRDSSPAPTPSDREERIRAAHRLAEQNRRLRAIDERIAQDRGSR